MCNFPKVIQLLRGTHSIPLTGFAFSYKYSCFSFWIKPYPEYWWLFFFKQVLHFSKLRIWTDNLDVVGLCLLVFRPLKFFTKSLPRHQLPSDAVLRVFVKLLCSDFWSNILRSNISLSIRDIGTRVHQPNSHNVWIYWTKSDRVIYYFILRSYG